jgi:hypothetical protein
VHRFVLVLMLVTLQGVTGGIPLEGQAPASAIMSPKKQEYVSHAASGVSRLALPSLDLP